MRTLILQIPRMTGSDVSAWQQFLTGQGFYRSGIDGIYGPVSTQGTRDYQSAKGLGQDGIAGIATFSQALRDGFESAAGHVAVAGMDASVGCGPFASRIAATGMKFVIRYYSKSAKKSLTRAEAAELSAANLRLAVVYEDFNNDIRFFNAKLGGENAAEALASAAGMGQPSGSAIYFAVDFDPSEVEVRGPVSDYFRALSQSFAVATTRYALGVYGSGLTCRLLRDTGLSTFTWLSGSTGFRESAMFRPQAHLLQVSPERRICDGDLEIEDDIAQSEKFGAFQIPSH